MTCTTINNKYHVEVLIILKDVQLQHGLRHKDYHSYRQYISKKLHRMRKSLNFQQGKGNKFISKKIQKNTISDGRYILLKLFEAERAWAAAMQLKAESNNDNRKIFHMKSRLKKAVSLAKELWELCKWEKCEEHADEAECKICGITDAHTYVETQAYYYNMQGVQCFELGQWKEAKYFYEKALKDYTGLAKAVDRDLQSVYVSKTEELTPLVRYCANNAGETSIADDMTAMEAAGSDLDQFNELIKHIYKNQVAIVTKVNWIGFSLPVKQESVKLAILALKDANIELQKSGKNKNDKIKIYDSLLKTITDALMVVRDELKSSGSNNPTQITNQLIDNLSNTQQLFVYLHYVKLSKTVERNLVIIETNRGSASVKPQNMARLYDAVVQNLQEMSALPGLCLETTNSSTKDNRLLSTTIPAIQELRAKVSFYAAYRCYYLSKAHLSFKRFVECAALLVRSQRHCEDTLESLAQIPSAKSNKPVDLDVGGVCLCSLFDVTETKDELSTRLIPGPKLDFLSEEAIPSLQENIQADQLICKANHCLDTVTSEKSSVRRSDAVDLVPKNVNEPLYKRLDQFAIDPNLQITNKRHANHKQLFSRLIKTPPDFKPIPIKPTFFDLAQHHVEFPNLDERLQELNPAGAEGGGIKKILKSWWWGSS